MAFARALVLLVDDDPTAHFLQRRYISKVCGPEAEIISVTSGMDAIQLLGQRYIDGERIPSHLFLDLQMPNMDGFEFLAAFERLPEPVRESIRVYVVTSSNNPDDHERAREFAPVRDIIDKGEVAKRIPELELCNGV